MESSRPKCGRLPVAVALLLASLVLCVPPVAAQDVTGALQGTVLSPEGKPEPQVRVVVSGPYLQGPRETTTDSSGFFQLLALPPGRYGLKLTRVGLQPIEELASRAGADSIAILLAGGAFAQQAADSPTGNRTTPPSIAAVDPQGVAREQKEHIHKSLQVQ